MNSFIFLMASAIAIASVVGFLIGYQLGYWRRDREYEASAKAKFVEQIDND